MLLRVSRSAPRAGEVSCVRNLPGRRSDTSQKGITRRQPWRVHSNRFPITPAVTIVARMRMQQWMTSVMLAVVLMAAGCKTAPAPAPSPEPALPSAGARDDVLVIPVQWNYTTRDEAGHDLTQGAFSTPNSFQPGSRFVGSWQANYVGPVGKQSSIGPQINGGQLSGEFTNEGQLVLDLNPHMNDNNVRFIGKIDREGHMSGAWSYTNFTGMANHGSFEANLNH